MSHIFYSSNWELWPFKNTSSGILFKLRRVSERKNKLLASEEEWRQIQGLTG
jgi:hypothetical protein